MKEYWEGRFIAEGQVWGTEPSGTAVAAAELFRAEGLQSILVPGAGYGRNAAYLAAQGFSVEGIEIADEARRLAETFCPGLTIFPGSVLDMPFSPAIYDGVYCFNVLHLFRREDRLRFIRLCLNQLRPGGISYFTVFSEQEPSFGRGAQVEVNTFESKPGRPVHYFDEADLREHFAACEVMETGLASDPEDHGAEGPHVHVVRYIAARKR